VIPLACAYPHAAVRGADDPIARATPVASPSHRYGFTLPHSRCDDERITTVRPYGLTH